MRIYRIIIRNYRNLKNFDWKPDPHLNVLFGPNGCGKSNLAEALSLVFSHYNYESYFDNSDYHQGNIDSQISIQVWLDDIDDLQTDYSQFMQHIDNDDNFVLDDADVESHKILIFQLVSGEGKKREWNFFQQVCVHECKAQARRAVQFSWIPVNREPLHEIGFSGKSALYQDAKEHIEEELSRISQHILQSANQELLDSPVINSYMDILQQLSDLDLVEQYRIMLKNPSSTWNSSGYELGTIKGQAQLSFGRLSNGIQNLFLLLLMKKKLEGAGIVFIEELEQNLEPQKQRYIANAFWKLGVGQLFITSHSPDVISEFDYINISVASESTAVRLIQNLDADICKLIYQTNKKEFIAALMSASILLVEGESENAAIPIFIQSKKINLENHDLFVFYVGGKGNLVKFSKIFKQFAKTVYVLLDNDCDVRGIINETTQFANQVFISCDSYEDLIIDYKDSFIGCLDYLVEFPKIRNKLMAIRQYSADAGKQDTKKQALKEYMDQRSIDPAMLSDYVELSQHRILFKFALHDSFATPYFARAIAQGIIADEKVPRFMVRLFEHLVKEDKKLGLYNAAYDNVYKLEG